MFDNLKQTVQTLSDPKTTTKQDAEDRYERVVGGSVMALDKLAQDLPVIRIITNNFKPYIE
jgi:hypothetical protein